jgi:transposase
MVMLAEQYEYVIGGDPDRDTVDVAVLDTATGVVRGHRGDTADGCGYPRLLARARAQAPGRRVWALEGTGSFAAGLATFLAQAGEDVVEVSGGKRPRGAKNDRIDAIRAARTALTREHQATPRPRPARSPAASPRDPPGDPGQPHESDQRVPYVKQRVRGGRGGGRGRRQCCLVSSAR